MNHSVTVKEEGEGLMLFKLTQNCILFLFISFLFLKFISAVYGFSSDKCIFSGSLPNLNIFVFTLRVLFSYLCRRCLHIN